MTTQAIIRATKSESRCKRTTDHPLEQQQAIEQVRSSKRCTKPKPLYFELAATHEAGARVKKHLHSVRLASLSGTFKDVRVINIYRCPLVEDHSGAAGHGKS